MILLYCPYESEDDIEFAKEYCKREGYTPETASIKILYDDNGNKEAVIVQKK